MVDSLGQLPWEANTVCKCLGKCPYDTFEGIQLLSACDWQEDDPQITAALFPDISPALNSAIRDQSKLNNQGLTSQDKENSNRYWNGARQNSFECARKGISKEKTKFFEISVKKKINPQRTHNYFGGHLKRFI